jgi:ribosomal protein S18 acetylase RimI-like enzyme
MHEIYKKIDQTQQYFWRSLAKEIHNEHGVIACYSGIDNKNFNPVIYANTEEHNVSNAITSVVNFYENRNMPWCWIATPFTKPDALGEILPEYGLELIYTCFSMICELSNFQSEDFLKDYQIKEATDLTAMTDWMLVLNAGFGAEETDDMSYRDLNMAIPYGFRHFVAYENDEAVAAGTLSVSEHGARIDNVATKPSHTRRGFGSAITLHAMEEAKRLGYDWCCLDASDEGLLMYKKLGFKECYETKIYGKV